MHPLSLWDKEHRQGPSLMDEGAYLASQATPKIRKVPAFSGTSRPKCCQAALHWGKSGGRKPHILVRLVDRPDVQGSLVPRTSEKIMKGFRP